MGRPKKVRRPPLGHTEVKFECTACCVVRWSKNVCVSVHRKKCDGDMKRKLMEDLHELIKGKYKQVFVRSVENQS